MYTEQKNTRTTAREAILVLFEEIFQSKNMKKTKKLIYFYSQRRVLLFPIIAIDVILRGIAQVFLCDHPITGGFICIGLALTSTELLLHTVVGTIFSTIGAHFIGTARMEEVRSGLCG